MNDFVSYGRVQDCFTPIFILNFVNSLENSMKFFVQVIILFLIFVSFQTVAKASFETSFNQTAAPRVEKVEPPSWWAGHTVNPVRLLVRGTNLQGASVRATKPGTKAGNVRVNGRGDYLFVDVTV